MCCSRVDGNMKPEEANQMISVLYIAEIFRFSVKYHKIFVFSEQLDDIMLIVLS